MRSVEATGKTVEEAIQQALQELGVSREQVDIEVMHQGTPGILGIGGEPARVRATVKDSPAAFIKDWLTAIVQSAGWDLTVEEPMEREGEVHVNLEGNDAGLIIGKRGETLNALQLLLRSAVSKKRQQPVRVVLDAAKYRERRRAAVIQLALNAADRARTQKRPVRLYHLTSAERRIVHITLQSDPTVFTMSEGEGANRVILVAPTELRQRLLRPPRQRPQSPRLSTEPPPPPERNADSPPTGVI